ncbi:MAG: hypothetical protein VW499_05910, partial [Candidatus Puniceispirillum sp.]
MTGACGTARLALAESLLADLVAFPSLSGQPNRPIVDYIASFLRAHNVPVEWDAHDDGARFNLFASIG